MPKSNKPALKKSSRGKPATGLRAAPARHEGFPVSGRITSRFGSRQDPMSKQAASHKGVDIATRINTPVRATGPGTVIRASWQNSKNHKEGYGQRITIDHGRGNTSTVGHLNSIGVKVGDKVTRGEVIGRSGNTGKSTGPHVHYEERYKGKTHAPTYKPSAYKPSSSSGSKTSTSSTKTTKK
jgi:murein DD-endopeptidase MepM/ murein hydrolase activator NlpD